MKRIILSPALVSAANDLIVETSIGDAALAIRCPHCGVTVPVRAKMGRGPVFTSAGVAARGALDENTAMAMISPGAKLSASYPLTGDVYGIAQCAECSKEFIILLEPLTVIWPLLSVAVPLEIPELIRKAHVEAKTAHAVTADTAALLAARTALIRMQRQEVCLKINELADKGRITRLLAKQADEVRLWANAMGHDDVPSDVPAAEDVEQLLEFMDLLFDTLYVQEEKLKAIRAKRADSKT